MCRVTRPCVRALAALLYMGAVLAWAHPTPSLRGLATPLHTSVRREVLIHELQNMNDSIRQLELEALEESKKKPRLKAYDPWAAGRKQEPDDGAGATASARRAVDMTAGVGTSAACAACTALCRWHHATCW